MAKYRIPFSELFPIFRLFFCWNTNVQHIWYALNQINQKVNGSNLSYYYSLRIGDTLYTFLISNSVSTLPGFSSRNFTKEFSNLLIFNFQFVLRQFCSFCFTTTCPCQTLHSFFSRLTFVSSFITNYLEEF